MNKEIFDGYEYSNHFTILTSMRYTIVQNNDKAYFYDKYNYLTENKDEGLHG